MKNVVITIGTLLLLAGTAGAVAPTITTQPSPSTVTQGTATSFTVAYGGGNYCAHPNPPGYPLVCN